MDIESYYTFMDAAGISPLCIKLKETDRLPALRFMLFMENVMCGEESGFNYINEPQFDENLYATDVANVFPDLTRQLRVNPERGEQFWETVPTIIIILLLE